MIKYHMARFFQFDGLTENDIIKSMVFVDYTQWDPISVIDTITEHFSEYLAKHKFNLQEAKTEFLNLKKLQRDTQP